MQDPGHPQTEDAAGLAACPPQRPTGRRHPVQSAGFGLAVLLLGVGVIGIAAGMDMSNIQGRPWNSAIILFNPPEVLPEVESYPVRVRTVECDAALEGDKTLQLLEMLLRREERQLSTPLVSSEYVIATDIAPETLAPLLLSGRLPEPGKPEVLAGDLARDAPFMMDGMEFTVVGRLQPTVSGFLFAYLLPHLQDFADIFAEERNAVSGVLVVEGHVLLEAGILPENPLEKLAARREAVPAGNNEAPTGLSPEATSRRHPPYLGGMMRAPQRVARLTAWGLLCVAVGSSLLHACLFRWLAARRIPGLNTLLNEMTRRPLLFWGMHLLLYGTFFYAMHASMNAPLTTYRVGQYVEAVFREGGLSYVGEAYASGNVLRAAAATFYNNYVVQTLALTFGVSIFAIPFGLLKCLLSFMLVGAAMTPMWVGVAQGYVIHVFTMALELHAYVIACFAIVTWSLYAVRILFARDPRGSLKTGLAVFFGAVLLTAVLLANAALYEAVTLILFI